ncbi:MAG TPA: YdgA family protein [Pseudomonas sp.]|nr:YdgA family protein [Pseudomonas sp.]
MKKSAGIAVGVIVAIGALGTAGAWYTGQQLPSVLDTSIRQANAEMAKTLPAMGISASVELLSLDRGFFSSNARYRVKLAGEPGSEAPTELEWVVSDRIEHGPFPLSRLKAFKLLPVMATSNYALEQNPALEKWFAASNGVSPLNGQVSLGYDRSLSGDLQLQPLKVALDEKSALDFSGLNIDFDSSSDVEKVAAKGLMDNLTFTSTLESGEPLSLQLKGLTLDSKVHKGASEFYLGQNDVRLQSIELLAGANAPILLKDIAQRDDTSEEGGKLSARYSYDIGMISYQGQDIGGSQMVWGLKNLDAVALKSMVELYGDLLKAGKVDSASGMPQLSEEQGARFKADLATLLAGKPSLALEKLSFKTANGESSLSLALELNQPQSFELPAPELAKQLITQLDAKVLVSKAMITDVVGVQAAIAGETDQDAIAQQASMMGEMAGSMAVATELATLQGEDIVSNLHYANGQVDFNGKQMSVEEFVAMAFATGGGLGMGGVPPMEESGLGEEPLEGAAEETSTQQ